MNKYNNIFENNNEKENKTQQIDNKNKFDSEIKNEDTKIIKNQPEKNNKKLEEEKVDFNILELDELIKIKKNIEDKVINLKRDITDEEGRNIFEEKDIELEIEK